MLKSILPHSFSILVVSYVCIYLTSLTVQVITSVGLIFSWDSLGIRGVYVKTHPLGMQNTANNL